MFKTHSLDLDVARHRALNQVYKLLISLSERKTANSANLDGDRELAGKETEARDELEPTPS